MTIAHLLEDFSSLAAAVQVQSISNEMLEEYRLEAFENGYKSGWDDASHAHADSQASIAVDLAQSLRDLSFTYHEARDHLIGGLAPLFCAMLDTLVPPLAENALAGQVAQQLSQLADENIDIPVEIAVAPGNEEKIARLLTPDIPMAVNIVTDPTLGEGQASLGFGDEEREIDITEIVQSVVTTLETFTIQPKESARHD